jgi:putative flippase GtrA
MGVFMTQTHATNLSSTDTQNGNRAIRTPFDAIITTVARRFGGSKAKEVERFLKFAMVGTLGAVIDLGTSFILLKTILDPRVDFQFLTAATISFIAAVMSNFFWNRYWTYPDSRSRSIQRQLTQFFIVSISGWTGRTIWLSFSKPLFVNIALDLVNRSGMGVDEKTAALAGGMVAILLGIFVIMIWNFFVNRYWTYNDVD